jgi:hypothetical protein
MVIIAKDQNPHLFEVFYAFDLLNLAVPAGYGRILSNGDQGLCADRKTDHFALASLFDPLFCDCFLSL